MSRPFLPPRSERRSLDARAAARGWDWGRAPAPVLGPALPHGWTAAPAFGGGVRVPMTPILSDDRIWRADLPPPMQQGQSIPTTPLYTYYASPEQEVPVHTATGGVFPHQWWAAPEYNDRDYLLAVDASARAPPARAWASSWQWDDAARGAVSDSRIAETLDASDDSEFDDEQDSMFRVERDGPPRPKGPERVHAAEAGAVDALLQRRGATSAASTRTRGGRVLNAGDSPLAFAPIDSQRTAPPAADPTPPPAAPDWTLRAKAERPEEEEDFLRCQQLSRCSDHPPCPSCLCFLCGGCDGCDGAPGAGGEGGGAAAADQSASPATDSPPSAPRSATTPRKPPWGSCRMVNSTRALKT